VVREDRRGYGAACLAGIDAARRTGAEVIAFMDGDGSDPPERLIEVIAPVERGEADLALGARDPRRSEAGALTLQQRFGNALAVALMRALTGARYSDLPPCKAITTAALERVGPRDTTYAFTIELLLRAHEMGLRVVEVPIACRKRRGGASKVSGTVRGTVLAGVRILGAVLRHARPFQRYRDGSGAQRSS
jgi:glycosyltransferase involved in cell wall biosynthesis